MTAPSLKILLAEDEPLNAMALQAQLEAMGHSVVALASNGRTAVELARAMPVDLAIMDVRMPVLSGLDAAREIFAFAEIPTILLTGYAESAVMDLAARIPVFHYLVKPIAMEELRSSITQAWERYQLWKEDGRATDPSRLFSL